MKAKVILALIIILIPSTAVCQIDPLKRHIIEGTYYMMVEGDLAKAQEEFTAALKLDPRNPEAAFLLGKIIFDRVVKGELPREKLRDSERLLNLADLEGIIYNRFHPDLLHGQRVRKSASKRTSFWKGVESERGSPKETAIAVFEMPLYLGRIKLLSPDEEGYTRSRICRPGDAIQIESGVKYRVEIERRFKSRSYIRFLIPVAAAAGALWLTMR
ncbi:TPA: hypothetical protein ENG04_09365 [Candidatus Poribacteria bacterium]|nr:hypothetical protein [Candidatus Poribacteria bacterium]HEX30274.1 hypothetical protein [Candidatus Poribacteria bacterium]